MLQFKKKALIVNAKTSEIRRLLLLFLTSSGLMFQTAAVGGPKDLCSKIVSKLNRITLRSYGGAKVFSIKHFTSIRCEGMVPRRVEEGGNKENEGKKESTYIY